MARRLTRRGEIYWLNFGPGERGEAARHHPALVVQNDIGNATSPATIVLAITSAEKLEDYPMHVRLLPGDGGVEVESIVQSELIYTVNQNRLEEKLGQLSAERMTEVDEALRRTLGLEA